MYRNIKKIRESPVLSGVVIIILGLTILYIYTSTRSYKTIIQDFDKNSNDNKNTNDLTMERPFLHIYDNYGKKTNIVFITHPFSRKELFEKYQEAFNEGYYFLGISSYIDFPGLISPDGKRRISNPYDAMYDTEHIAWDYNYFELVKGWCHCFRNPDLYIPSEVPKLLLSESDFISVENLEPGKDDKDNKLTKDYDFIYVCLKDNDKCEDGWQSHNRNWELAQYCLDIMCNKFHLQGLLVGSVNCKLPSGCHNLMKKTDFMEYGKFINQFHRARFIFFPNQYDASPRILAEALARGLPALVNYNILGGWKYINQDTGEFFHNINDFETQLKKLLKNFNNYKPKEHFLSNYGKQYQGKELLEFVKSTIPLDKLNFDTKSIEYLYPGV